MNYVQLSILMFYSFTLRMQLSESADSELVVINDRKAPLVLVKDNGQLELTLAIPKYENTPQKPITFRIPEGRKESLLVCPAEKDSNTEHRSDDENAPRGTLLLPNGDKDKPCSVDFVPDVQTETTGVDLRCYDDGKSKSGHLYKVGYWIQGPVFLPLYKVCYDQSSGIFYTIHTIHSTQLLDDPDITPGSTYTALSHHSHYAHVVDKECADGKNQKYQLVPYRDMPVYTWQITTLFYKNVYAVPSELKDHLDKINDFIRKAIILEAYDVKVFTGRYVVDGYQFHGKILTDSDGAESRGIAIVTKYPFTECDRQPNIADVCEESGWSPLKQVDDVKCTYCHPVVPEIRQHFGLVSLQEPKHVFETSDAPVIVINDAKAPLVILNDDPTKPTVAIPEYDSEPKQPIKFHVPEGKNRLVLIMCPAEEEEELKEQSDTTAVLRGTFLFPRRDKKKPCVNDFEPDIQQGPPEVDRNCYNNGKLTSGVLYRVGYWLKGSVFVTLYEICFDPKTGTFYTIHTIHPTLLLNDISIPSDIGYISFSLHSFYTAKVNQECKNDGKQKYQLVPYRDMPIYTWQKTTFFFANVYALPEALKSHLDKVDDFIRKIVVQEKQAVIVFTGQYSTDKSQFIGKILINSAQNEGIAIVTKYPFEECDKTSENQIPDICEASGWSGVKKVDDIKCTFCHRVEGTIKGNFGLVFLPELKDILKVGASAKEDASSSTTDIISKSKDYIDWFIDILIEVKNYFFPKDK